MTHRAALADLHADRFAASGPPDPILDGWAVHGAQRLVVELLGGDYRGHDFLQMQDAALSWLHAGGVPAAHLTGHEAARWTDTNAAGDPVGTLVQLLAVPRDLAVFFGKLADVAPEDIRPDVETIRDLYQAQADGLGDDAADLFGGPANALGGIAGDLVSGLAAAPALQRVDAWTTTHCGPPPTT